MDLFHHFILHFNLILSLLFFIKLMTVCPMIEVEDVIYFYYLKCDLH